MRTCIVGLGGAMGETFVQGKQAMLEQVTLSRMAMRHLYDAISEISTFAHRAARWALLRQSILQRCYRDIHSGTQHIPLRRRSCRTAARVLLGGAAKDAEWMILNLPRLTAVGAILYGARVRYRPPAQGRAALVRDKPPHLPAEIYR